MKQTEISDRGLIRLVPATYHKPPVLRGLVDSDEEVAILAELEGKTSARLVAERGRNTHIDARELAWNRRKNDFQLYGNTHVNAAFTYTRQGGNRFNSNICGAWYCAWSVMTSVAEVAFHKTRELGFIGIFEEKTRYVELLADFIGIFDDLTDDPNQLALHPEPEIGYQAGQSLARQQQREGAIGFIYPSVRAVGENCLVCFDPEAVRNVRPGASWDITWSGTPDYSIVAVA